MSQGATADKGVVSKAQSTPFRCPLSPAHTSLFLPLSSATPPSLPCILPFHYHPFSVCGFRDTDLTSGSYYPREDPQIQYFLGPRSTYLNALGALNLL